MPGFSVIVPTLNEADTIHACLQSLQSWGNRLEIIVVDGGSQDGTREAAAPLADQVLTAPRGRALQMNAGARAAQGSILIFLHADTHLPPDALPRIQKAVERGHQWGRFDVELAGRHPFLPAISTMMNLRSRLTGIATGDQAVFVIRQLFERVEGFPLQPLMEDIELSRQLGRHGRPACLRARVRTSARRWETFGLTRTILLMWWLRLGYFCGADPATLNTLYQAGRFL